MTDAAVGFQCPTCVAEGARSTRAGRATYGGRASSNPMLTSSVLIGLNVVVWIAILVTGGNRSRLVDLLGLHTDGGCFFVTDGGRAVFDASATPAVCGEFYVGGVADGWLWQLLSSAFVHVEIWHIAGNMLALAFLGPQLEAVLGRARFVALYLLSALAGAVAVYWLVGPATVTYGASGAIFGLVGALVVRTLKVDRDLSALLPLLVMSAVFTFVIPDISWQGHLGGFLGGLATMALLVYAPRGPRRGAVQWAALGGLTTLLTVAILVRTLVLV